MKLVDIPGEFFCFPASGKALDHGEVISDVMPQCPHLFVEILDMSDMAVGVADLILDGSSREFPTDAAPQTPAYSTLDAGETKFEEVDDDDLPF